MMKPVKKTCKTSQEIIYRKCKKSSCQFIMESNGGIWDVEVRFDKLYTTVNWSRSPSRCEQMFIPYSSMYLIYAHNKLKEILYHYQAARRYLYLGNVLI